MGFLTEDFQSQLDQLNEVTSNILSRETFIMSEKKQEERKNKYESEIDVATSKSQRSDIMGFNEWQNKMSKNVDKDQDPLSQMLHTSTEEDRAEPTLNTKSSSQDLAGNKKAQAPVFIKKKDIILKSEIKK